MVLAFKVMLSIIAVFSIVTNSVICYIMIKKKRKNTYQVLCLNLAIAGTLQTLTGYFPELFLQKNLDNDSLLCKASSFCVTFFAIVSIALLSSISLSRSLVIKEPFLVNLGGYKIIFIKWILPLSWFYGLFWSSLPLIGVSRYTLEESKARCSIDWKSAAVLSKIYLWLLVTFCFVLPIVIVGISSHLTRKTIMAQSRYFSKTYGRSNLETKRFESKERKALRKLLVVFVLFLLAWTPYAIVGVLASFMRIPYWLSQTSALCAKCSSFANPSVYFIFQRRVRRTTFRLSMKKNSTPSFSETREVSISYQDKTF